MVQTQLEPDRVVQFVVLVDGVGVLERVVVSGVRAEAQRNIVLGLLEDAAHFETVLPASGTAKGLPPAGRGDGRHEVCLFCWLVYLPFGRHRLAKLNKSQSILGLG